ncbi:BLUF domain-containing protein [Paracoccus aerodenitrificans]|uniref:BLUF domain-containing protein n=1 Tax=Paracoccus aerodenitrificans TaxID=3017781 RepID=UPI0022F0BA6E|nr:BLUF domain-containing protein [Paracoccus aerodenitrificans]WBU65151.1 BLUF domain-containing protein [Paracoccus aerodenitrificans]
MTLTHLLYRSSGRIEHFQGDCDAILAAARVRNAAMSLTGFLHAEDGIFVQWLEGPKPLLDQVVDDILADTRHRDITVFGRGPITKRQFPSWAMGYSNGHQAPLFDWLAERETNSHDLRGYADSLHQFLLLRAA